MSCLQLHADEANCVNTMQNELLASFMCQNHWENIQVIFGLEVGKGNNHTLLVVEKFNFTILVSKIQRSVTLKKIDFLPWKLNR